VIGRGRVARAIAGVAVVVCAAGCAAGGGAGTEPPINRLPLGRALVLGRVVPEANRAVAEAAADLLARSLRPAGDVMVAADLLGEVPRGDGAAVRQLIEDLRVGRWPDGEACERLERLGLSTLVIVTVTTYEQVWGKYAKFTRVGLEAQAVHLPGPQTAWRFPGFAEIEDKRGRAFQIAMEEAVGQIASAVYPRGSGFTLAGLWRSWRR
jgi:hypothetical protein